MTPHASAAVGTIATWADVRRYPLVRDVPSITTSLGPSDR
jgi:hypothetical protein